VLLEVRLQRRHGGLRLLAGRNPQADLRAGGGQQGVRGIRYRRCIKADDADRRASPQPLGDAPIPPQLYSRQHPRFGPVALLGELRGLDSGSGQAGDGDVPGSVMQCGEQVTQGAQRIGGRAAVHPGMDPVLKGRHLHDAID